MLTAKVGIQTAAEQICPEIPDTKIAIFNFVVTMYLRYLATERRCLNHNSLACQLSVNNGRLNERTIRNDLVMNRPICQKVAGRNRTGPHGAPQLACREGYLVRSINYRPRIICKLGFQNDTRCARCNSKLFERKSITCRDKRGIEIVL